MIVCSCRNISDSNYDSPEQLLERLLCDDWVCGTCIRDQKMNSAHASEKNSAVKFSNPESSKKSLVEIGKKIGSRHGPV